MTFIHWRRYVIRYTLQSSSPFHCCRMHFHSRSVHDSVEMIRFLRVRRYIKLIYTRANIAQFCPASALILLYAAHIIAGVCILINNKRDLFSNSLTRARGRPSNAFTNVEMRISNTMRAHVQIALILSKLRPNLALIAKRDNHFPLKDWTAMRRGL